MAFPKWTDIKAKSQAIEPISPSLAAIAGYIVMALSVFVTLSLAYSFLGPEAVFVRSSTRVSHEWTVMTLLVGLASGLAGGYVCGWLGKSSRAFLNLVGIVLVLGVAAAVYDMVQPTETLLYIDPSAWGFYMAARGSTQPLWFDFLVPLLGALGALWGGRKGFPDSEV